MQSPPGVLNLPCGPREVKSSAPGERGGCALERCLLSPGRAGGPGTPAALNLLLLFMTSCCFLVPQLASVPS